MKKNNNKNKGLGIFALVLTIIVVCLAVVLLSSKTNKKTENKTLAYTDLIKQIAEKNVNKVEMVTGTTSIKVTLKKEIDEKGNIVQGGVEYKEKDKNETENTGILTLIENINTPKSEEETKIEEKLIKNAIVPNTESFIELIQDEVAKGNDIELIQKTPSILTKLPSVLFSLLPTIIMVALFVMIFKMQGLTEKGEVYDDTERKIKVKFEDVAGLNEEKAELIEIVDFLKNPKKYTQMGAKIPKGILLYGKPGTGKTLIAKAIAGEAGVPFISMSGSEFIEMFAGLGASRVRKLFDRARKLEPCIVFIDEIDAIGSRRTSGSGAETENNQTLNQLLVEMDGFSSEETIIVLAATNRPEMLDKALLRPGRFDRQIVVPAPDLKGREDILKIHAKDKKFAEDVTFKGIAEDTAGFTGAELANILNEAAIIATKNEHKVIEQFDVEEAVKKVTVGLEKKNRVISEKEKNITAYHEAGHAVVSWYLPTQTEVKEISIVPRGMAGGYTMYKNDEDKSYISKTEMEEKLIALLGGRAAEQVALGEISTGASNDIEVATQIARDMVIKYGMSKTIGTISLKDENGEYPLEMFGADIGDKIGKEIKQMLDAAYNDAQSILKEHYDKLDAIAQRLLVTEKINAEEFKEFFE
ncbi:MAG: ATP-dependent zinc metalloprotease FtsH [Clostridia bacterium]|nr:ATP-dependent zinc metalloprotease FtsH [Clostridia bacterium]